MFTQVTPFKHELFGEIRITEITNLGGNPWFVANDIAAALGYKRPADTVRNNCKDVQFVTIPTSGGNQRVGVIPDSDVYRLIFSSRLFTANKFKKWVFEEILPTIRKVTQSTTLDEILTMPETSKLESNIVAGNVMTAQNPSAMDLLKEGKLVTVFEQLRAVSVECLGDDDCEKEATAAALQAIKQMYGIDLASCLKRPIPVDSTCRRKRPEAVTPPTTALVPATPVTSAAVPSSPSPAPIEEQRSLLNPTQIGQRLRPKISAILVNRLLEAMGLQTEVEGKPKRWKITVRGTKFGRHLTVCKKHSTGSVAQLKWFSSIVFLLQEEINIKYGVEDEDDGLDYDDGDDDLDLDEEEEEEEEDDELDEEDEED
jgi:prophage antirepressor-like protein